jgi:hypothetical protein
MNLEMEIIKIQLTEEWNKNVITVKIMYSIFNDEKKKTVINQK